jgi:ATP phosphoribosyltransferase regulatory subunit
LRRQLLDLFHVRGYELVMPPLIEYLDSLLIGRGDDLDLQTFKVTDRLTGRLMGVRADITPQVARIDANRIKRDAPTRFCYVGSVLHALPVGFAANRAPTQVGAELYGHAGIESDLEILHLMIETLAVTGVENIHVDLGHVAIFRYLASEAGLSPDQETALFDAMQRKAKPDMHLLLEDMSLALRWRDLFLQLVDLNGDASVLDEAQQVLQAAGGSVIAKALDDMKRIADGAQGLFPHIPLHFDLAELRGYRYKTGVVFAAFVPGHGQEVARGGRYDEIGAVFGRARPATGFSTHLNTLIQLSSDKARETRAILAPYDEDSRLQEQVRVLRAQGERVIVALPGQQGDARELGCDRKLENLDGQWAVVSI